MAKSVAVHNVILYTITSCITGLFDDIISFFFFLFFHLTYSRWTSSLPSCLWSQRIFPSLPGSRLTIFYRDASSALLQLINQWFILYYYHWYCTVLSLYCTCGSPNRKESSPNSSSAVCCKLESSPTSSPRPPRSCGLVPSYVQAQLPVSVHRLTCATQCSFSSLLRAPKLTSAG